VKSNFDNLSSEILSQLGDVTLANQENVLVLEFTSSLLGHLLGFEFSIVNELAGGKDWLVFGFCFERNILDGREVDL
jgi:hypothetical protein